MDTHTPSQGTAAQVTGKTRKIHASAAPGEGESAQHLGSKEGETSSQGKTLAQGCQQQIQSLQTHIQQNVAASQHQTLNHVFTAVMDTNPAGV